MPSIERGNSCAELFKEDVTPYTADIAISRQSRSGHRVVDHQRCMRLGGDSPGMSDSANYWQRLQHARTGRRRLLRTGAVGVAGLGAAWLAACGGGDSKSDSGGSGSQTQSTVAAG